MKNAAMNRLLGFIIAVGMMFSSACADIFAFSFGGESYNVTAATLFEFSYYYVDDIKESLRITSASAEEINNGLTFGEVLPASVTNYYDPNARLKGLRLINFTPNGTAVKRTDRVSSFLDNAFEIDSNEAGEAVVVRFSIAGEWDTVYGSFLPYDSALDSSDGGVWSDNNTAAQRFFYSSDTVTEPKRNGCGFAGWLYRVGTDYYEGPVFGDTEGVNVPSWNYNEYAISYVLNGGINAQENPAAYTFKTGVSSFAPPSKEGSVFAGWYSDPYFMNERSYISESEYGNITLYAKWIDTEISVSDAEISGRAGEKMEDYALFAEGGSGEYCFSAAEGSSLPEGIVLNENGVLSGSFNEAGSFTALIQAEDKNYGTKATAQVKFSVEKALAKEVVFPDEVSLTYGARLCDVTLSGEGSGYFEWVEPELIPEVKAESAEVRFVPDDYSLYPDDFEYVRSVSLNVEPAEPVMKTAPTVTSLYTNIRLRTSKIRNGEFIGVFGETLEGTYEWVDGIKTYSATGAYNEKIVFTPENENYKPVEFEMTAQVISSSTTYDINYKINIACSKNGRVSPSGDLTVDEYSDLKIRFIPDEGYKVSNVEVDGGFIDKSDIGSSYTFENITADHIIYVYFTKDTSAKKSKSGSSSSKAEETTEKTTEETTVKSASSKESETNSNVSVKDRATEVFDTDSKAAYISGYPDGSFRPSASLSRAEAAVILSGIIRDKSDSEIGLSFTDVSPDDWYYTYVSSLAGKGIINGYSDGSFRPDRPITRAELVGLVSAALGCSGSYSSGYTDINGHWARDSIGAISAQGWINGYPDGSFRPDANITRAEAVTFLNAVIGRSGEENGKAFSDVNMSDWFYKAVMAASGG